MDTRISEFLGTNQEYETIRSALSELHNEGVKSPTLLARLEVFRKKKPFSEIYTGVLPDYGTMDRLRGARRSRTSKGPNRARDESFVNLLWIYLQIHWPRLVRVPSSVETAHPFYHHMLRHYDADEEKSAARLATAVGRYAIYHFSERFRTPEQGVVLGELVIEATGGGRPFTATEREYFDGTRFNYPEPLSEDNSGYCVYKHSSIVVVLAEQHQNRTPKWYLFDHPHVSGPKGIGLMTGHMCQLVQGRDLFTSPVCARKIRANEALEFNIFYWREIREDVMDKLLVNPLPEFYERKIPDNSR